MLFLIAFEYLFCFQVEPTWKLLDQFVTQQHYAFALDALATSHQISIEVGHPDEINDIFDRISYTKGNIYNYKIYFNIPCVPKEDVGFVVLFSTLLLAVSFSVRGYSFRLISIYSLFLLL